MFLSANSETRWAISVRLKVTGGKLSPLLPSSGPVFVTRVWDPPLLMVKCERWAALEVSFPFRFYPVRKLLLKA